MEMVAGRLSVVPILTRQGYVTTFQEADMLSLRDALEVPISEMNTPFAGLLPEFQHIELFASQVWIWPRCCCC